ncbi:hypothetical protein ACA910_005822 [Epithemia clementina (nom. ined.)]
MNLPGTLGYQPGLPWIAKRRALGEIAMDTHDYFDDLRGMAHNAEEAWQAGSRIAKIAAFHGIQDAARKRCKQTQRSGAWAGVVCGSAPNRPFVAVTQSKWDRTKEEVKQLCNEVNTALAPGGNNLVDHKSLEQVVGYLNHVARAYPTIKLYLNGVYATLSAWRPDRDEDGWKTGRDKVEYDHSNSPSRVRMVKRMRFDVEALEDLTKAVTPPEQLIRPARSGSRAVYVFGDASGAGFGTLAWSPGNENVEVDYGAWSNTYHNQTSSNFGELASIVEKLERLDAAGRLDNRTEYFISTDNSHAESAFYRGTAKSPEVLHLMFRLHRILIKGQAFVHIIWVAGKCMID